MTPPPHAKTESKIEKMNFPPHVSQKPIFPAVRKYSTVFKAEATGVVLEVYFFLAMKDARPTQPQGS